MSAIRKLAALTRVRQVRKEGEQSSEEKIPHISKRDKI